MKGKLNYDRDACIIQWISEEFDINELEPFLQYIRADNGEDWIHVSSEEDFKTLSFNNFEAISGEDDNTFYIHYNAEIEIDLDSLGFAFPDGTKKKFAFDAGYEDDLQIKLEKI